jgi:putative membrane protein
MWLWSVLARWGVLTAAVVLTSWVLPGVSLEGGPLSALWVALLIGLVNVVLQVLLRYLPTPRSAVVLAVLTLALNGLLVWVVSALTSRLTVDGFPAAVAAAVVISVLSTLLALVADRLLLGGRGRTAAA